MCSVYIVCMCVVIVCMCSDYSVCVCMSSVYYSKSSVCSVKIHDHAQRGHCIRWLTTVHTLVFQWFYGGVTVKLTWKTVENHVAKMPIPL